ncbi:MAG: hypothetical protein J2P24_08295 [Streptosporangiales bacterium]|nr:hypothetical protein [Streptosporangiales bacterium]
MTAVNRTEMFRCARDLRKGMEVEVWIPESKDRPEQGVSAWLEVTRHTEVTAPIQAVVFTLDDRMEYVRHPLDRVYSRRKETDQQSLRDRVADRLDHVGDRHIHGVTGDVTAPRWTR